MIVLLNLSAYFSSSYSLPGSVLEWYECFAEHSFDVEEGDERQKRISTSSSSPHSGDKPDDDCREPYDCISNPAPWWHQLTVSHYNAGESLCFLAPAWTCSVCLLHSAAGLPGSLASHQCKVMMPGLRKTFA